MTRHVPSFPAGRTPTPGAPAGAVEIIDGQIWVSDGSSWSQAPGAVSPGVFTGGHNADRSYTNEDMVVVENDLYAAWGPIPAGRMFDPTSWRLVSSIADPKGVFSTSAENYPEGSLVQHEGKLWMNKAWVSNPSDAEAEPGAGGMYGYTTAYRYGSDGTLNATAYTQVAIWLQTLIGTWQADSIEGVFLGREYDGAAWTNAGNASRIVTTVDFYDAMNNGTPLADIPTYSTTTLPEELGAGDGMGGTTLRLATPMTGMETGTAYVLLTNLPDVDLRGVDGELPATNGNMPSMNVWLFNGPNGDDIVGTPELEPQIQLLHDRPLWYLVFDPTL